MTFNVVILAAGQSKRMRSTLPKILHSLAGKPILEHIVLTVRDLNPDITPIIIYGSQANLVQNSLNHLPVQWVLQSEQLGTGHALQQALPHLNEENVLVLCGDVPLISAETLSKLISHTPKKALGLMTAYVQNPAGLGRIVRDDQHQIKKVVEEKDATHKECEIKEINTGIYLIPVLFLKKWLSLLENKNAQKEYYLTDIISLAIQDNIPIHSIQPNQVEEILGVNNKSELAELERIYQLRQAKKLMEKGVTLMDPNRFDLRGHLTVGQDVFIDINVIFEGNITIGDRCKIGPNSILRNVILGNDVEIKANSLVEGADIGNQCIIGPFARIRAGTQLGEQSQIGNFVEVKNSIINSYTKINHLSYIGDSNIGRGVNIGAGTITCNYDGANKHKTTIGNHVFIGSGTQLVAPVKIGEGATIGAGSTITDDAPSNQLTICRAKQRTIEKWRRPIKKEKES